VRWQLWIVAFGFFMQSLDTTIVNTALPSMVHMQRTLPEAFGHRGEGGVDDGGVQRLHKEAERHYP
jgi:MFS family permease